MPAGGEVKKAHVFESESGPVTFADLFGDKQTLALYSFMDGPQRLQPCAMCTSLLPAWDGDVRPIEQRLALVAVARSPIQRLVAFKQERGWRDIKVCSQGSSDCTRDCVSAEDADVPGFSIFARRDGVIRHFWGGEMGSETADPGQDPRGAPDLMMADPAGGAPFLRPLRLHHVQRQPGIRGRWKVGWQHTSHRRQRPSVGRIRRRARPSGRDRRQEPLAMCAKVACRSGFSQTPTWVVCRRLRSLNPGFTPHSCQPHRRCPHCGHRSGYSAPLWSCPRCKRSSNLWAGRCWAAAWP